MATKQLMTLAVLAVLLGCSSGIPKPRPKARDQNTGPINRNALNNARQYNQYPGSNALPPVVNNLLTKGVPSGAQLINVQPQLLPIMSRLPDNSTLIRQNIVDNFRCEGSEFPNGWRKYGYYADQDNECQIFHVCLPLQQLYPDNFTIPVTYQFSFICPEYTIFSQDALTCAWANEAVPCEYAQELYSVNDYFFTNKGLDGEVYGNKVEIPRTNQGGQRVDNNQRPINFGTQG